MRGQLFSNMMAQITPADQQMIHAWRYKWAVLHSTNICTPTSVTNPDHAPFTAGNYVWHDIMGSINGPKWRKLQDMRPEQLFVGDPLAPSLLRPGGFRAWDCVVGIPGSELRGYKVRRYSEVPTVRKCNTLWLQQMEPALRRTGPIGYERSLVRPMGRFILDLKTMDMGWSIVEAAHVLTHLRGEDKPDHRNKARHVSQLSGRFNGTLGEIAVSLLYDLPLDVSARDVNDPGSPDFCYGIEVKTSTTFMDPVLKVPVNNNEAPQPDRTLGLIQVGAFVEPHPYGYENKTDNVGPEDHWCCIPSILMVVGWEAVDVVTHYPMAIDHIGDKPNPKAPQVYAMRPADLLSPELFWAGYLASAHEKFGPPKVDDNHQYFHDWIVSDHYKQLLAETPPLICEGCLTYMPFDDNAPKRPRHLHKKNRTEEEKAEDQQRAADCKRCAAIINTAIERFERRHVYSSTKEMTEARKTRKSNYMKKLLRMKEVLRYLHLHVRVLALGRVPRGKDDPIKPLTPRQKKIYRAFEAKHGAAKTAAIIEWAKTKGLLDDITKQLLRHRD